MNMQLTDNRALPRAYQAFGNGSIDLLKETGRGATAGKWGHIAETFSEYHWVLQHERQRDTMAAHTPENIGRELYPLLQPDSLRAEEEGRSMLAAAPHTKSSKPVYRKKRMAVIWLCLALLGLLLLIACQTDLKIAGYSIRTVQVTDPIRLVFLSDLHSCDYGDNQSELMSAIIGQQPDAVLLGGDIVDDVLPQGKAQEFLDAVSALCPCFYVSGNHEYWSRDIDDIKQMIEDYGIEVLEGDTATLTVGDQRISISGVDDPEVGETEFAGQLNNCNRAIDENVFSVLISHRPERVKAYSDCGFDLILAGHAHGGQWRIPYLLNGLIAPNQGLFPKYAGGPYEIGASTMIVGRGLAKESTRIPRLFNPPEVVVVDILPA